MANFEPPSFSLGLDLDADSEPQFPAVDHPVPILASNPSATFNTLKDNAEDLDSEQVMDSDPDLDTRTVPPRALKRLRRDGDKSSATKKESEKTVHWNNGEDEIEEFSSQEINDVDSSTKYHSLCSSSKLPLKRPGILFTQSCSQTSSGKKEQVSVASGSASFKAGYDGLTFPNLTISPLRRFQLLDSDSDDPSECKDIGKGARKIEPLSKDQQSITISPLRRFRLLESDSDDPSECKDIGKGARKIEPLSKDHQSITISPLRRFRLLKSDSDDPSECKDIGKGARKIEPLSKDQQSIVSDDKRKTSFGTPQNEDLWRDFSLMESSRIQTPAFDEVCKEYFQSFKDKNASQKLGSQKVEQLQELDDPSPPARRYFFHADPRIQKLVRSRLPFFSPLSMDDNGGHQQPNVSVMDFTSQFSNGESSKQRGSRKGSGKECSTSRGNKSKKPTAEKSASEGWLNLKSSGANPKNAGKRRVHANSQPAGHWFTSPEGRKVYVTKTGQELSGQMAYRHYRKESGGGFRKSKKKSYVKKKG